MKPETNKVLGAGFQGSNQMEARVGLSKTSRSGGSKLPGPKPVLGAAPRVVGCVCAFAESFLDAVAPTPAGELRLPLTAESFEEVLAVPTAVPKLCGIGNSSSCLTSHSKTLSPKRQFVTRRSTSAFCSGPRGRVAGTSATSRRSARSNRSGATSCWSNTFCNACRVAEFNTSAPSLSFGNRCNNCSRLANARCRSEPRVSRMPCTILAASSVCAWKAGRPSALTFVTITLCQTMRCTSNSFCNWSHALVGAAAANARTAAAGVPRWCEDERADSVAATTAPTEPARFDKVFLAGMLVSPGWPLGRMPFTISAIVREPLRYTGAKDMAPPAAADGATGGFPVMSDSLCEETYVTGE
mmetsp:Transcript_102710/g.295732  ORF Transcript_102710/g.295732 Transcript_102710/m.295732 type:complete len:356 (+) Transcript_102710:97-1164(+)